MGKDVRLFHQDKIIMKLKNYAFALHKKAFRDYSSRQYAINVPLTITELLLQAVIYIFVCAYALTGVFGIGSIIKYIGFVDTLIRCIQDYSGMFPSNIPELIPMPSAM